MDLIADILLIAGALGAAVYCVVLSRRLSRFTDLEKGVGGAIAVLSAQVDDMNKALEKAREAADTSTDTLDASTEKAEGVAKRLELLMASLHDIPDPPEPAEPPAQPEKGPPAAGTEALFLRHRNGPQEAAE